jgi:hypothetical protein
VWASDKKMVHRGRTHLKGYNVTTSNIHFACGTCKLGVRCERRKKLIYKLHWKGCKHCKEVYDGDYKEFMNYNGDGRASYYVQDQVTLGISERTLRVNGVTEEKSD